MERREPIDYGNIFDPTRLASLADMWRDAREKARLVRHNDALAIEFLVYDTFREK